MIRKVQRRFIASAALAVALLMAVMVIPFNIVNFYRTMRNFRITLSYIIENGGLPEVDSAVGLLPESTEREESKEETEQMGETALFEQTEEENSGASPGRQDQKSFESVIYQFRDLLLGIRLNFNAESRYQLRYFLVQFSAGGEVEEASVSHIAAISEAEAVRIGRVYYKTGEGRGLIQGEQAVYYFMILDREDGGRTLGVLDVTTEIHALDTVRNISLLISVMSVVLFLILITLLSGRAIQPYVENMEAQKQFITNAGHELKTPLAIISANTEVIEVMNGRSEWTKSILDQVRRSTDLINQLILLSRMTEAAQVELQDLDFSKLVREAADSFRPVIGQMGKTLAENIQEGVRVRGETRMVTELVNILVDNAGKYCDDAGTVRVDLKKRSLGGAVLTVENDYKDGEGEDYSKYFQRFYRADESHNSGKSGYGIGLSMASTVVEKLKGSIRASWKAGVITFTVTLPGAGGTSSARGMKEKKEKR